MSVWSTCVRCKNRHVITTMNRFNTDVICVPCEKIEKEHPKYLEAWETELAEVKRGNYNYEGIGLPPDLHI